MLDRAFRVALRDFTTYALIAAVVYVPLHLIYSFVFQDTIAVSALHGQIADLSSGDTVRGVGASDLTTYRMVGAVVLVIDLLLLPALAFAALAAFEQRERGELPSVRQAWAQSRGIAREFDRRNVFSGSLITALLVAVVIASLVRVSGLLLLEPMSDRTLWAGVALVEAIARSSAAPFVMVPAALLWRDGLKAATSVPNNY